MILRGIRFGGRLLCILEFDGGIGLGHCSEGVWCIQCCRLVIIIKFWWATVSVIANYGDLLRMEILCSDVVSIIFHQ